MNKSTKIWLNYGLGIALSALLLCNLYNQVKSQLSTISSHTWAGHFSYTYLYLCLLLLPLNIATESYKWNLLCATAQPLSFLRAFSSVIAGVAFSTITPNRIGEYPGRILYLKVSNTLRLITVSILGMTAQLFTIFFFGNIGLIYYYCVNPTQIAAIALSCSMVVLILIGWGYAYSNYWMSKLEKNRRLRRLFTYSELLKRIPVSRQLTILLLSFFRFLVYSTQDVLLLYWMNIHIPVLPGLALAALFFWAMSVIPYYTIAELGVRGQVGIYIFSFFSNNSLGVLIATISLWCINFVIPAVLGSLLMIRARLIR